MPRISTAAAVASLAVCVGLAGAGAGGRRAAPPRIDVALSPACLWPANQKLVAFELGRGLAVAADDERGPATWRIVSVASDSAPPGGAGADRAPDVVYGPAAFCVRARRPGPAQALAYTVVVEARGADGGVASRAVEVRVARDRAEAERDGCASVEPARYVRETDPRCTAER